MLALPPGSWRPLLGEILDPPLMVKIGSHEALEQVNAMRCGSHLDDIDNDNDVISIKLLGGNTVYIISICDS